jgi:hypothetical protein
VVARQNLPLFQNFLGIQGEKEIPEKAAATEEKSLRLVSISWANPFRV